MDNDREFPKILFTSYIRKKRGPAPAETLTVYDSVDRLYRPDFILDVKTVFVASGTGVWTPVFNADQRKCLKLELRKRSATVNMAMLPLNLLSWHLSRLVWSHLVRQLHSSSSLWPTVRQLGFIAPRDQTALVDPSAQSHISLSSSAA